MTDELINKMSEYITQNFSDCAVEINGNELVIVPEKNLSMEYYFTVAGSLYKEFGINHALTFPSSSTKNISSGYDLNVAGYATGDSNNDGEVGIADAVMILQSISNPDKYQLSAQGKFNANIYNTGDGITTADALQIQILEAGIQK